MNKPVYEKTPRWKLPVEWRPEEPVFAFHEDSNANAALITPDGGIFAAAEERLTRRRFQGGFPKASLAWIESASGVRMADASTLVFGNRTHFLPRILGKNFPSFEHDLFGPAHKLMLCYQHLCFASPAFSSFMELVNRSILCSRFRKNIRIYDHHYAHAASAYYTSGLREAVAVTADNFGDGYSAKVFDCSGADIRFLYGSTALHSPGQFYGEIAQIVGIHPLLAGKLTGMAASGDPAIAAKEMAELFSTTADGRDFASTFSWGRSSKKPPFTTLRGIEAKHLAAAAQARLEDVLTEYVKAAVRATGRRNVVLAGGSFANVRANQRVLELPEVDSVWIHPAMTDQGIAMGAALAHIASQKRALPFIFPNVLLGPEPTLADMEKALADYGFPYDIPKNMPATAARLLADGKVVARYHGALEYGPRALGNRSILYQIQDAAVQDWLNKKLHRAHYMPFAPVTMEPYAEQCYAGSAGGIEPGRFMTIAFHATDWMKKNCPGVVHIDGTVRPQILRRSDNPGMYAILEEYHKVTGMPSLLNTSFNMHEEPIVCSPDDACRAFEASKLDYMIMGPYLVRQP